MVQVYCEEKGGRLRCDINGHANLKNIQQLDVLCACCTTLANTLALNVMTYKESGMLEGDEVIYLGENGEGKARISCKPTAYAYPIVKSVFSGLTAGFEMLSKLYPAEVEFIREIK